MYRRHGQKLGWVFLGADLLATAVAWFGGYYLRFLLWPSPKGVPELSRIAFGLPLVLILAAAAYRLAGLYEVHRLRSLPRELGVLLRANGLLFLLLITALFYGRDLYESRLGLITFLASNALALVLSRRMVWRALKVLRGYGLNRGRAIIVGSGRTARQVAATIASNAWTGLEAVGFVDQPSKTEPSALPRLGEIADLSRIVKKHRVDHVFLALPLSRYGELPAVHAALVDQLVEVQLVPDLPHLAGIRVRNLEIDDLAFLSLRGDPHLGWRRLAKRFMDLSLGGAMLLIAAPLMALLALAIKATSRGPVLFLQPRAGLGGRVFMMAKFRSMRVDAENATGPVWAKRGDDRCTPLGRFMRRWNLDELPQLFNVLAGDMSLVGPRPERNVFIKRFRKQMPTYAQRHQVKAGITGWAQVNGWRGNTSIRRRLECDLYYISNWSLALDLKILLLTGWRAFGDRHAY